MMSRKNGTATKTGKKFTVGALNFLTTRAGKMSARKIANVLHRTEKSIRRKAEQMGVSLRVNG